MRAFRRGEGDKMPAGLQHAKHLGPQFHGKDDVAAVPFLAHEPARQTRHAIRAVARALRGFRVIALTDRAKPLHRRKQMIGRVGHNRVDAVVGERVKHGEAIARAQDHPPIVKG